MFLFTSIRSEGKEESYSAQGHTFVTIDKETDTLISSLENSKAPPS